MRNQLNDEPKPTMELEQPVLIVMPNVEDVKSSILGIFSKNYADSSDSESDPASDSEHERP